MPLTLESLRRDPALRAATFPVTTHRTFLSHAAVAPLPACASDALRWFADQAGRDQQESPEVWQRVLGTRATAARLLGCTADEIALLGPTAMGLNLVADGLDWAPGDEVVYYRDDYPANVYPWTKLAARGVKPVPVQPERTGQITWEAVEAVLTPRTRLVALASAHFLTGFRIDVPGIGRRLRERGILFCLDGIQTLGAFPTPVEHVDFLSADSHKWLIGPLGAGIVYVRKELFPRLRPTHLGSWNVTSPNFVAQDDLNSFYEGARRYECGSLNVPGILAMRASMEMLLDLGIDAIAARILELRAHAVTALSAAGFEPLWDESLPHEHRCGITTFRIGDRDPRKILLALDAAKISASVRHDRVGTPHLRVSPHIGNTEADLDRLAEVLGRL